MRHHGIAGCLWQQGKKESPAHFGVSVEKHIERLEPLGEPTANGERRFRAVAAITEAPFALRVGSSFKAEIVIGRKQVYRIILEQ